jgi:hypothetical protein
MVKQVRRIGIFCASALVPMLAGCDVERITTVPEDAAPAYSVSSTTATAELPRTYVNTAYVAPTGKTINVPAGGNLQAALDAAQPGDQVVLKAGAVYKGNFRLRKKTGTGWIVIRSSATLPPAGTRIRPADSGLLAKLVGATSDRVVQTELGASRYRLVGLEIASSGTVTSTNDLVRFDSGSSHLILDRSYVHGHSSLDSRRCVSLNASYAAVIDSHLSQCHSKSYDSQAIAAWNTSGPLKIVNNHLAGAGENIMFGGAMPAQNVVPSDIEIRGNHFYKPTSWKGVWLVKNLFEIKNAQRVLLEGNVFQNNWRHGQDGMAINIKVSDQNGKCTWCVSQDITFRKNIVRNVDGGMKISATNRIVVRNNLFKNLRAFGSNGRLFQLLRGAEHVRIENNTGFGTYGIISAGSVPMAGFVMRNNIVARGAYGIKGDIGGEGTGTLEALMPSYTFLRNVLIEAPSSRYPENSFFPSSTSAVKFVDYSGGNYRLASTSPYKGKGTDGKDPGANIDAIVAATDGVVR